MFKRRILCILAIVAMLTLSFGAQAMAGAGGSVELTNAEVTPFKIEYVGGGTWDYGTRVIGEQKHVWSHYHHPTKYHSATAKIANYVDKKYAYAGYWAFADVYGPKDYTGYAWWATY